MPNLRLLLDQDKTASAPDFAFAELARRIITGQIAAGSRITEEQLAKDIGVSRTPLRTALSRLEAARMVVRQRNRSIYVAPVAIAEVRELAELRARIEGMVAYRAAERACESSAPLERLAVLARMADHLMADPQTVYSTGREFHQALIQLSGLIHVSSLLESIYLNLERYRYMLSREQRRVDHRQREHQAIADAVIAGNAPLAEQLMQAHIHSGLSFYIEHLQISN